ncbi:Sigma-70, region 4 [Treponema bryantii]|uniref:Sigma-70, region 4 n=1 Tax=Treponema bryantii TaxID=163 RepID=A0A1I3LPJ6_9SPIR|nr:sigma factor-like helix-turn-helix DNA-binding protein [Treponema bryantii]SFI86637.1 Sigma-70, region 4 [Treponema bryantii]
MDVKPNDITINSHRMVNEFNENLNKLLPPLEQEVIRLHFGFNNEGVSHTMKAIAKKLSISEEEVHNILQKTLKMKELWKTPIPFEIKKQKEEKNINYFEKSDLQKQIISILDSLPTFEREVISKKYGLETGTEQSDAEIQNYFNITSDELEKMLQKVNRRITHNPFKI